MPIQALFQALGIQQQTKTVPDPGKLTFQWGGKTINKEIYNMRAGGDMCHGAIKQEIREGLSDNVTLQRLLRSYMYLGEPSRMREQPGQKP